LSFSAIAASPIFAPAPKVGALGEIGIPYILYISTVLARQPSAVVSASLRLLALIAMDGMYAGFAGAYACHEKIRINRGALWS